MVSVQKGHKDQVQQQKKALAANEAELLKRSTCEQRRVRRRVYRRLW
jgi:ribonuclease PH